ncbi:ATP-binding cassette domain-containing protein [Aeromicrobium sp. 636]|uniref:ABC transporter ATP-binding protein n=1 Tax=Aeromicrobium senzhongii TaxID=2663859 RepID=A0A8I0K2E2_9ACTN|nr:MULTISPECIES: ABC transporter ATP-binding protein [Aeromicrobium]MBC9226209.1 ABC transporter ATP-binding protein [Aeromicrobium senzhongii]MCQ3998315.1 ATP-binding cassette domain-containing protein [Aeromicrobium sp. 636]
MTAIELQSVSKSFGAVRALDRFDMVVRTGEVHGFLGPNGSGKSTSMRVLLGLLRADAGTVRLLGGDPWTDAAGLHRRLAYVPGEVSLWANLTGGEVIDVLGRMRGGLDERRRSDLIERFGLDPSRRCGTYSKGNRQKVALVAALAAPAELYLFDEPTAGLDPLKEAEFQRCVHELRAEGATILLSSHIMAEVEALADRVTIIRQGRSVLTSTLDDLRTHTRTTVRAETTRPADGIDALPGVHHVHHDGGRLQMEVDSAQIGAVMGRLSAWGLVALEAHPPTLEELFLREYEDEERT